MASSTTGKYKVKNTSNGSWNNPPEGVNILSVTNIASKGKPINVYMEQWQSGAVDFMITSDDNKIAREMHDITMTFVVGRRYASTSQWYVTDNGTAACQTQASEVYLSPAIGYLTGGSKVVTNKSVTFYTYSGTSRVMLGSGTSYTNNTSNTVTLYLGLSQSAGYVDWNFQSPRLSDFDEQSVYDAFVDYMTDTDVWIASSYVGKQIHCVANEKVEPKGVKLKRGNNSYILGEITFIALEKPSAYSG